jgi:hypothetical protein
VELVRVGRKTKHTPLGISGFSQASEDRSAKNEDVYGFLAVVLAHQFLHLVSAVSISLLRETALVLEFLPHVFPDPWT